MSRDTQVSRRAVLRYTGGALAATVGAEGVVTAGFEGRTSGRIPVYGDANYELKVGDLHSHTAYSDGAPGTRPSDTYTAGRTAGLDFKAVTDHSEWFPAPVEADENCLDPTTDRLPQDCAIDPTDDPDGLRKWEATKEQAVAASTDDYLGLRGFEWSSQYQGHVVVHGTRNYSTAYETGGATMHGFWEWFTRDVELGGGADGLAFFAHPGREPETFEDFRHVPEAADRVVGCEVFNRDDEYFDGGLARALDVGWRTGAVGSTDNHAAELSRPDRPKTVLVVPSDEPWSRATLRQTLLDRRFYASYNEDLRVRLRAAGNEMGSAVEDTPGQRVGVRVDAFDPTAAEAIEGIVLYTNGATEVARTTLDSPDRRASLAYDATVPADGTNWYVAKVVGSAGREGPERGSAFSSPVWLTGT